MEIFGPTIQGEGMVVGRKTMFVRTGGCDYSCSWCDSAFTWDGSQKATMMTAEQVWKQLLVIGSILTGPNEDNIERTLNFDHVTISGGNPALIRDAMDEFIDICHANGVQVGLETQGSRWQDWFLKVDDLTISPKPPSSKMVTNFGVLDEIVAKLEEADVNFTLKVVIFDDVDFEYAKKVDARYMQEVFYVSVGNEDALEEGDISERLLNKLDWLWEKVLEDPQANHWRPLPQLHALVWDNKRGV